MIEKLIEVKDLEIYFKENDFTAVKSISFDLYEGEILALVGESGSGKSLTASSIIGLAPLNSQLKGQIYYKGEELYPNYPVKLRGHHIAMIPQDTLSALNPVFKVGEQVYEAVDIWRKDLSKTEKKNFEIFIRIGQSL